MEPGGWNLIHKSSPIIPVLNQINSIRRIDTYFFKIHCNIAHLSTPRLPQGLYPLGLPVKILKVLLPSSILATFLIF